MHDSFLEALNHLQGSFMSMGINVSEQIYQAIESFKNKDDKLAEQVIKHDENINSDEINLEKEALNLIALQQPVANDFRSIISFLKASSDLERIGDHAATISKETIRMKKDNIGEFKDVNKIISKMEVKLRSMLEATLDAFLRGDESSARLTAQDDILIDKQFVIARNIVTNEIKQNTKQIPLVGSYLYTIRLLERIGDHIVNLDEQVVYSHSGKIIELNPGKLKPDLIRKELQAESGSGKSKSKQNK
ncbi:phosphate transport system regulatory protein PhoU [Philodulcilactobacillus myokoensis]|uniref:Phosphate-specific transport system accessory protein PhoU n=1 Tax=Philodulcilactobacillus myokoensis TaxID=2929573 RepID=A0A9W6B2A6_9LACO|nr:phosphate signaling complex protein PhoU [Philodulcilactobacillus myokoensis]GLB47562.1 phosphate transport system regulatory protein PhoU [Philodulcilactobacillus myokoensis]